MKVTEESIKAKIKAAHYFQPLGTLTVCVLELANGLNVVGKSACVAASVTPPLLCCIEGRP